MILRNLEQRGITVRHIRTFSTLIDPFTKLYELTVNTEDFTRPGKLSQQSSVTVKFNSYHELVTASNVLANALSNSATLYGENKNES